MRGLYYRLRFAEFRHPTGLALFADRLLAACLREYAGIKKAAAARIQLLKEQRKALYEEQRDLDPASAPSFEATLRNARQLRFEQALWLFLVVGEGALTYFAALVFLPGRGLILAALRVLIAFIATGVAVVVAEKFIDEVLTPPTLADIGGANIPRRRAWGWGALFLGLECALWGLASIRAADMEGSTHSPVLYIGLILLSVLIAPAAGGIRHDLMQRLAPVRRVQRLRAIDSALEETAKQLAAARHSLESKWEVMCQEWYGTFADFRAHKEIYNVKRRISETTAGAYFDTRVDFCTETRKRRDSMYGEAELLSDDVMIAAPVTTPPMLTLAAADRDQSGVLVGRRSGE